MCSYRLLQCTSWLAERKVGIITFFLVVLTSFDLVLFMRLVKQMHNYTFLLSQLIYPLGFTLVTWFISLIFYRDRICCLAGSKCCKRKGPYQTINELNPLPGTGNGTGTGNGIGFGTNNSKNNNDSTHVTLDENPEYTFDHLPRQGTTSVEVILGPKDLHDREGDEDSAQENQGIIDNDEDKYREEKSSPQQRFSIRQHWTIMISLAVFDTLSGTMTILPILYLPSIVLLLFGQLTLPLNLLLSKLVLHYQYQSAHYYGAAVVLLGVVVASYADSYNSSVDFDNRMLIFWALLLLIVKFMDAGTTIYRERMLKKHNLKAWHTTVWVSLFQSVLSLLLLPVILIPFPKPWIPVNFDTIEPYVRNAFHCLFGQPLEINIVPVDNDTIGFGSPSSAWVSSPSSYINLCTNDNNLVLFAFFLFINVIVNVLSLQLIKLKSSNYAITMTVLKIGISAFLFSQEWLAGAAYHTIVFLHVIGFLVILFGILVYSSQPSPAAMQEGKQSPRIISVDSMGSSTHQRKQVEQSIVLTDDEEEVKM